MRLLADECIWRSVVTALQAAGWDVKWIHDVSPSLGDREVLKLSDTDRSVLLTEDGDFGGLIFDEGLAAHGVARIRLSEFEGSKDEVAQEVALRVTELGERLIGHFTTIEPGRIRQRALPNRMTDKD